MADDEDELITRSGSRAVWYVLEGSDVAERQGTILQAGVFLEDAEQYRSIFHKIDITSLKLYRIYYSKPVQWSLYIIIFLLHALAFVERPSSLTWSSDPRYRQERFVPPCGATESVELFLLTLLTLDLTCKAYLRGKERWSRSKWLIAYFGVLFVSLMDWTVSIGLACSTGIRIRRLLRPFFLLQHSSIMKKTVNCLKKTLPEVVSVLILMALHIYFFALIGMLIFPKPKHLMTVIPPTNKSLSFARIEDDKEGSLYFKTVSESLISLLVLLTTANNPDVMLPSYKLNRLYAIYFIVFLIIGLYLFMNILTAVIYNQFRGYFMSSMQSSLLRRKVGIKAAFEVLRIAQHGDRPVAEETFDLNAVPVDITKEVVSSTNLRKYVKRNILNKLNSRPSENLTYLDFQEVFRLLDRGPGRSREPELVLSHRPLIALIQKIVTHKAAEYFGHLVALTNTICITVELALEYDKSLSDSHAILQVMNLMFILYYTFEQSIRIWATGWRRYMWRTSNVFDGLITILLVLTEAFYLINFGDPFSARIGHGRIISTINLWDVVRIINMLILLRVLRLVAQFKTMSLVAGTVVDLVKNFRPFAGILIVIYYTFAVLGIMLFQDKIKYEGEFLLDHRNVTEECGTYRQLGYWANNFDDFAAAIVVLWDVMVVNNWFIFLNAYSEYTSSWSQLFFIAWWLVSVVISLNLFTALVLENFIMKWDRLAAAAAADDTVTDDSHRTARTSSDARSEPNSIHAVFRDHLREPSETELEQEINSHPQLRNTPRSHVIQ